jgi:hypothetical protein
MAGCAHKRCDRCCDAPRRRRPVPAPGTIGAAAIDGAVAVAQPYCVGGPAGRLLDAEAKQLGSASVHSFETEGLIGARRARAFTGWRRSGPMAMSGSRCWGHSQPQPPLPAETPFDAASSAHCAADVLADALVEHGLPRHQLETNAVIDHGEAAALKLGGADKGAADIFARLGGGEGQTAFGSHGLADTSDLRTLQIGDKILGHADTAVLEPDSVAHVHKALPAAIHGLSDLPAEPGIGKCGTARRGQFPVEPGRAIASDLLVKAVVRQDAYSDIRTVARQIVGLTACGEIGGYAPVIGIDPHRMASPTQRFQPADMGANEGLRIATDTVDGGSRPLQMLGRAIDALCVPKTSNPTIVVMKSAKDGA